MRKLDFERKAKAEMAKWLDMGKWSFGWMRNIRDWRMGGCCDYMKAELRFAPQYVRGKTWDKLRDTVLHEIAHALAPLGSGHGPNWLEACRRVGCSGTRCLNDDRPARAYACEECGSVRKVIRVRCFRTGGRRLCPDCVIAEFELRYGRPGGLCPPLLRLGAAVPQLQRLTAHLRGTKPSCL